MGSIVFTENELLSNRDMIEQHLRRAARLTERRAADCFDFFAIYWPYDSVTTLEDLRYHLQESDGLLQAIETAGSTKINPDLPYADAAFDTAVDLAMVDYEDNQSPECVANTFLRALKHSSAVAVVDAFCEAIELVTQKWHSDHYVIYCSKDGIDG